MYIIQILHIDTVYPKKYAHGFCFAVLCCGYTFTDFPISIRLTSLALWQSNDCPSASKATLMNMDKYFIWIHYERLHNHNKAKHNKTVCIFLGLYCTFLLCVAQGLNNPTSSVAHAPRMSGLFYPPSLNSDPDMHHGTCVTARAVTHVPWCMSGSPVSNNPTFITLHHSYIM